MLSSGLDLNHDASPQPKRGVVALGTQALHVVIAGQNRMHAEALGLICTELFPGGSLQVHTRGHEALSALQAQPADILMLGLTFADMDGVDLLNQIWRTPLATRVLLMSERWDEHVLLSLRTARFDGAVDLFTESIDMLKLALQHILAGRGYISATLRRYLIDELPTNSSSEELTTTELKVLRIIGDGTDNLEAAGKLGISEATVQTHRRNIMRKLKISTSAKLVREAVRLGVVRIPPALVLQRPQLALFPRETPRSEK